MQKQKVVFLCTGNSIRSQMAEGYLRALGQEKYSVFSAGVSPAFVHPLSIKVMEEERIDISDHRSKSVADVPLQEADWVITLCGHARDLCPPITGRAKRAHWPIDDPVGAVGTLEERLERFRYSRDDIKERITRFLAENARS